MPDLVSYTQVGDVAHVTFDDGKANALSHAAINELHVALDRASSDAKAVVLSGRPGRFSAGFDLSVMNGGPDAVRALVRDGALLMLRMYEFNSPVIAACTGHALAAGAIMLMASDVRIAASGTFKIGLNEVAIGMPVPIFAAELARDRLSRRHVTAATLLGTIYDPQGARDAGYVDEVVDAELVVERALERATELAGGLNARAFAASRPNLRGAVAQHIRSTLDADIATFFVDAG